MEAAGELAQLGECEGKIVAGGREHRAPGRRIGVELRQRDPQRERERDQALLRTVMEVALEAAPSVPSLRWRTVS
jgi:hypothetical protein